MKTHTSERRTEQLVLDLLNIQGWSVDKPPKGHLIQQNEYKGFLVLENLFAGKSKSGAGIGYPDFILVDPVSGRPQMIIETKASLKDIFKAQEEACFYAQACLEAGYPVLAVGIAGQEKEGIKITVSKYISANWTSIVYEKKPISWIPTPLDTQRLLKESDVVDLVPVVPRPEVLISKAELMNRILREANVKDEYRPAYIGAMMLALWHSRGTISRDPENVLQEINANCEAAFAQGRKEELAKSLRVDAANTKLANKAWIILSTLEKLNVVAGSVDHDYLGQLYELFFRYTGGNTIGQYFTPRHVTRFMADLCQVGKNDVVIDPACGTGGFLIACIQRAYETLGIKYEDAVEMVKHQLIGYESEPVTAALCVANMILRGDGTTGIRKADSLTASDYPLQSCDVALMNPPFPHKKTDVPSQIFVERALEALTNRGLLAVILPGSLLVKKEIGEWRGKVLKSHTLEAVCQLPDELFQPYASATTSVVILRKGVPHSSSKKTTFVRIQYDGLTLKKGNRVTRADGRNDVPQALDSVLNTRVIPGFSGTGIVSNGSEWSPGAYIASSLPTLDDLKPTIDELLRRLTSFYVRYGLEVAKQRERVSSGDLKVTPYRELLSQQRLENADVLPSNPNTIGSFFDIYYGQKALHSRDGIPPGDSLIISPTEQYNGCYGWLEFEQLLQPPFITVAQTGSIGEAFVQLEPCGVNDDCLILLPKPDFKLPLSVYFIAAAIIRLERWRFNYGRKLTPARICDFYMTRIPELEAWVEQELQTWGKIAQIAVDKFLL